MPNRWNIPPPLEQEVLARDKNCVYCGGPATTWEHIVNDARIVTRENIARCCGPCNSSKGTKDLTVWLESKYCETKGITKDTVAEVVRGALLKKQPGSYLNIF